MALELPSVDLVFQFDKAHATIQYKCKHSAATGCVMPSLEVMVIDEYRYQREWSLAYRHKPGDSAVRYWESHIYQHPGRRHICEVAPDVAKLLMVRFVEQCDKYPTLLFNERTDKRPCCEGFVHFADMLMWGTPPSAKLLG